MIIYSIFAQSKLFKNYKLLYTPPHLMIHPKDSQRDYFFSKCENLPNLVRLGLKRGKKVLMPPVPGLLCRGDGIRRGRLRQLRPQRGLRTDQQRK